MQTGFTHAVCVYNAKVHAIVGGAQTVGFRWQHTAYELSGGSRQIDVGGSGGADY
jgi:hypothetical protein